jgi:hypothetical protein
MLYSEMVAVLFSEPHKTHKYFVWAERGISERQTCSCMQETLGFKRLIKLGSQDWCYMTNIISYIQGY